MWPREMLRWFGEHVRPVLAAYYESDLAAARERHAAALTALAADTNPDMRLAKQYRLDSSWFIVLDTLGERAESQLLYFQLRRDFAPEVKQPGFNSEASAAISLLLIRLHADSHGLEPAPVGEVLPMLQRVPDDVRGPNFWHEVACWAFTHQHFGLLDEAYMYFATQRTAEMADYMYARLRLMQQLLAGTAEQELILDVLRKMEVMVQLDDFNRLLLPAIEGQGLLTPLVRAMQDAKLVELEVGGHHAPLREDHA